MIIKQAIKDIKGLRYLRNIISPTQKQWLLETINNNVWCDRLYRRQQYYGIKYFQTKIEDHILQSKESFDHYSLEPFGFLINRLIYQYQVFEENKPPNQVLVNKYTKKDKLGMHVEDKLAFGQIIVGVSLGSIDYLRLNHVNNNKAQQYYLEMEDCSAYVLEHEARHDFKHGIGRVIHQQPFKDQHFQRISLTIRHVIQTRRKIVL